MKFEYVHNGWVLPPEAIAMVYEAIAGHDRFAVPNPYYSIYRASPELTEIVRGLLGSQDLRVSVQTIRNGIPIHVDVNRDIVYNFLIEQGGVAPATCFYDEADNETFRVVIEPLRWHTIDTRIRHTVQGIETQRVAITAYVPL
jgi:hypothetical protein